MRAIAIVLAGVLLAGCSAQPDPTESTPTPTPPNPNVAACESFVAVFNEITNAFHARDEETITIAEWRAIVDDAGTDYAGVALEAEGEVKVRIEDLVDLIDRTEDGIRGLWSPIFGDGFDRYEDLLQRIGQACTASGYDLEFATVGG